MSNLRSLRIVDPRTNERRPLAGLQGARDTDALLLFYREE